MLALGITVAAFALVPTHASAQATNFILPAGTATTTGICTGADEDSNTLLDAFGFNNLPVEVSVSSLAVDSVDQGGEQEMTFTWSVTLSQELVGGSVVLNVTSLEFRNTVDPMQADAGATGSVTGNTAAVGVPLGDGSLPVTYQLGPYTGTVTRTDPIGSPITFSPGAFSASIMPFAGDSELLPQTINVICSPTDTVPMTLVDEEGTTTTTESTSTTSTTRPPANTTTTIAGSTVTTVEPVPATSDELARTGGFHMELFLLGLGLLGAGAIMSGAGQRASRRSS